MKPTGRASSGSKGKSGSERGGGWTRVAVLFISDSVILISNDTRVLA